jgi:hypothetical protein
MEYEGIGGVSDEKCEKNYANHVKYELNFHRDRVGGEIHGHFDFLGSLCNQLGNLYPLFVMTGRSALRYRIQSRK